MNINLWPGYYSAAICVETYDVTLKLTDSVLIWVVTSHPGVMMGPEAKPVENHEFENHWTRSFCRLYLENPTQVLKGNNKTLLISLVFQSGFL